VSRSGGSRGCSIFSRMGHIALFAPKRAKVCEAVRGCESVYLCERERRC